MHETIWSSPVALDCPFPCLVSVPRGHGPACPVLFLLHDTAQQPGDWWGLEGQLAGVLAGVDAPPLVLVAPLVVETAGEDRGRQSDLPLESFVQRFREAEWAVSRRLEGRADLSRRGVLGIGSGGTRALALAHTRPEFGGVGVLSGDLQGARAEALRSFVGGEFRSDLARSAVYYQYCGAGATTEGSRGDAPYYGGNAGVCAQVGGVLRTRSDGMHEWAYWRPHVAGFLREWLGLGAGRY